MTHFWNFGKPLISRERLKLETLYLAQRLMTMCINNAVTVPFFNLICYTRQTSLNSTFNAIRAVTAHSAGKARPPMYSGKGYAYGKYLPSTSK